MIRKLIKLIFLISLFLFFGPHGSKMVNASCPQSATECINWSSGSCNYGPSLECQDFGIGCQCLGFDCADVCLSGHPTWESADSSCCDGGDGGDGGCDPADCAGYNNDDEGCQGNDACVYHWATGVCDCGGGCFLPETQISTTCREEELMCKEERVAIEELKAGDMVVSFDEETGDLKESKVKEIHKSKRDFYYELETESGYKAKVTAEHPFFVGKGEYKEVAKLKVGDIVYVEKDNKLIPEKIVSLRRINKSVEVYNLTVEGDETFFADSFAVHNKNGCFLPGTKIKVLLPVEDEASKISRWEEKETPIENLKEGDLILAFDQETGQLKSSKVAASYETQSDHYFILETASRYKVKVTGEHPFYIGGGEYKKVKDLEIGDIVYIDKKGELIADKVEFLGLIKEPVTVYNLTVEGEETFFANGFAVHNKGEDLNPKCGVEIQPQVGSVFWSYPEIAKGSDFTGSWNLPSFSVTPGHIYEIKTHATDWRNLEKREPYPPWPFACTTPYLRVDTDRGVKPALNLSGSGAETVRTYLATKGTMTITVGWSWTRGREDPPECGWWNPAGTTIDWIQVREISGAGTASSSNVNLRVGVWDDQGFGFIKIQNPDGSWPGWSDFPFNDTGRTFSATLPPSGSINVKVMDYSDINEGECSDTISLGPVGWLDPINCDYFPGWAGDKDVPNQAIDVHFYATTPQTYTWEATDPALFHQTGRAEGTDWSANVAQDSPAYLNYGPYSGFEGGGHYRVTWRLMIDVREAANDNVINIDVNDATTWQMLGLRNIYRNEFTANYTYQDFSLEFDYTSGHKMEFRTWWHDRAYIKLDKIVVTSDTSPSFLGSTTANRWREKAVCDALGGNCGVCTNSPSTTPPITSAPQCYHGFSFTTPSSLKDGQNHTIYAYGINAPGTPGSNAQLSGVPKTINCPIGTITGKVYQNPDGQCSWTTGPPSGWKVECGNQTYGYYEAETQPDGQTYKCKNKENTGYGLPYGTYIVRFKTIPAGWLAIPACSQDSVILSSTPDPPVSLYLWQGAKAWFQTEGGDSHGQGSIKSYIPIGKYFCKDLDNYPGVVSYGNDYDFSAGLGQGEDRVSLKGWLADSGFIPFGQSIYDYFYQKLKLDSSTPAFDCGMNRTDFNNLPGGFYWVNGDCSMDQSAALSVGTRKLVIFVNGNLSFAPNFKSLSVDSGGFLAFIVKGNINISGQIGDKTTGPFTGTNAHLQGIYLADGVIDTYEPDPSGPGSGSGFRLVGAGLFYAKAGFSLQRDLKDDCSDPSLVCNARNPAELFIFRPDLVLNAPSQLWVSEMSWLEVAP